jgi:hypothetical protein
MPSGFHRRELITVGRGDEAVDRAINYLLAAMSVASHYSWRRTGARVVPSASVRGT